MLHYRTTWKSQVKNYKSKFENPNNEKECNYNNEIIVFRDEDYVYYYYVDFNDGVCKWLEAEYLHKIANEDTYLILV